MSSYRLEVTLSESNYRGDRDERLTTFTVSGEGKTHREAIRKAINAMGALGYDPALCMDPANDEEGF